MQLYSMFWLCTSQFCKVWWDVVDFYRHGETFDLSKHPQVYLVTCSHDVLTFPITGWVSLQKGTEVKAITYSNMQIHDTEETHEVYVIVDIWGNALEME